jgi:hypothetical protein
MPSAPSPKPDIETVPRAFNTITVAVGSLYLATHSVLVTITATAAAGLLTCWVLWLARRERAADDREHQLPIPEPLAYRTRPAPSLCTSRSATG